MKAIVAKPRGGAMPNTTAQVIDFIDLSTFERDWDVFERGLEWDRFKVEFGILDSYDLLYADYEVIRQVVDRVYERAEALSQSIHVLAENDLLTQPEYECLIQYFGCRCHFPGSSHCMY